MYLGSGPDNIGVEVLQENGDPILNFGDEAAQNITPGDTNTSLVPFSAQLYNKTGGVPDANGYILSVATLPLLTIKYIIIFRDCFSAFK